MPKLKIIEPPQIERASPIVFTGKKDVTLRIWVHYRNLKALIDLDAYPTQCMDEGIKFLEDATMFSTFGANRDIWQVDIAGKDSGNPLSNCTTASFDLCARSLD